MGENRLDRLAFGGAGVEQKSLAISGGSAGEVLAENARWQHASVLDVQLGRVAPGQREPGAVRIHTGGRGSAGLLGRHVLPVQFLSVEACEIEKSARPGAAYSPKAILEEADLVEAHLEGALFAKGRCAPHPASPGAHRPRDVPGGEPGGSGHRRRVGSGERVDRCRPQPCAPGGNRRVPGLVSPRALLRRLAGWRATGRSRSARSRRRSARRRHAWRTPHHRLAIRAGGRSSRRERQALGGKNDCRGSEAGAPRPDLRCPKPRQRSMQAGTGPVSSLPRAARRPAATTRSAPSNWKCGRKCATAVYTPGFPGTGFTATFASRNG